MKKPENEIFFEGFVLWGFMQRWKLRVAKCFQMMYIDMGSRGWKIKTRVIWARPCVLPKALAFPFLLPCTHMGDRAIIVTPAVKMQAFHRWLLIKGRRALGSAISLGRNFHEVIAVTISSMQQPRKFLVNNFLTSCYTLQQDAGPPHGEKFWQKN